MSALSPSLAHTQTNQKAIDALPAIICLLICDDDPTKAPKINDIGTSVEVLVGPAISKLVFTNINGTDITNCSVSPSLPAGLSIQVSTNQQSCEIVGEPTTVTALTTYTITATNNFGSGSATVQISVAPSFSISGTITYDRVPTKTSPVELDYNNITQIPVRGATVQLLDNSNAVIDTFITTTNGNYQFYLATDQAIRVRVRAELLKTSSGAQYAVKVVDNTSAGALYTMVDNGSTSLASANPIRNMNASSGWGGSSYTGKRVSAPFAILDTIYEAVNDVIAIDPDVEFPPLLVNWSINNTTSSGDISTGAIGTSFYSDDNLYILGAENNDTDEFDDHVIVHEWGHYFEDKLSRSDSIGGVHGNGDRLDMRVAFGEGFGNALSGMITDDPLYIDTTGANQSSGFTINVDGNNVTNPGWYSEGSVQSILYDLYDSNNDGVDVVSLGLAPIYSVLVNEQRNSSYFTSIFPFITALKTNNAANSTNIDTLVNGQSITSATIDDLGSTESNNAGQATHVLPVYQTLILDGPATNVCTNTPFNSSNDSNKLANTRFLTFNITSAGDYDVEVANTLSAYGNTDPDFSVISKGSTVGVANSGDVNSELLTLALSPGTHSIDLTDFNISIGSSGIACFDIELLTSVD